MNSLELARRVELSWQGAIGFLLRYREDHLAASRLAYLATEARVKADRNDARVGIKAPVP